jgi:hypothetical protein
MLHSLQGSRLHDEVSSVRWQFDAHSVVTLFEDDDGRGRRYSFGPGSGRDRSTHGEDFKDCASTWRWASLATARSVEETFDWIPTVGRISRFSSGGLTLGSGHLQGLGVVNSRIVGSLRQYSTTSADGTASRTPRSFVVCSITERVTRMSTLRRLDRMDLAGVIRTPTC